MEGGHQDGTGWEAGDDDRRKGGVSKLGQCSLNFKMGIEKGEWAGGVGGEKGEWVGLKRRGCKRRKWMGVC